MAAPQAILATGAERRPVAGAPAPEPVLEVENLQTVFYTRGGLVKAVDGVSFTLGRSETLAIVGELGCGKSVTALSLMRLVSDPGRVVGGSVKLDGRDLVGLDEAGIAPDPRQRHLHDLPGADDVPQPGHDHRPADRRGADPAPAHVAQGGRGAGHRDVAPRRHPRAPAARQGVPPPAFRRHAPARHDRHGARLQSEGA